MKRLIAIALFIAALVFGASGFFILNNHDSPVEPADTSTAEAPLPGLFILGALGCLSAGIALWAQGSVRSSQPLVKGDPTDTTKAAGGGLPKPLQ